jgi:hypothetical protein
MYSRPLPLEQFPPSAGTDGWERERPIVTSQLEPNKAGQHSLSNTNELTNTSAADEEIHLDAIKPGENRIGTNGGILLTAASERLRGLMTNE